MNVSELDPIYTAGIQKAINEKAKQRLVTDGSFGPKSVAALKICQDLCKIPQTGVYDAATRAILDPFIRQKFLTMDSIVGAADMLKVTPAHVRTVTDVEARGAGFLPDGRCLILFERHHFLVALRKKLNDNQINALRRNNSDIISDIPGGYLGNEAEYGRFNRAFAIDQEAAIYATSWGLFQIMGFNHTFAGYDNLRSFCDAMRESETKQLNAFVRFNRTYRGGILQKALIAKDWASYAQNYNGPAYKKNAYDTKLADSFDKYSKNINAA